MAPSSARPHSVSVCLNLSAPGDVITVHAVLRYPLSGIPNKKRRNRPVTRLWTDASYLSAILRIAPRCDPRRGGTFPVSNTPVFPPSSYRNSHSVPHQGCSSPFSFPFSTTSLFFQANRRWLASFLPRGEEFHIRNPANPFILAFTGCISSRFECLKLYPGTRRLLVKSNRNWDRPVLGWDSSSRNG